MTILKFVDSWIKPPTKKGHCCDCEGCDIGDKECDAMLPRYCKICGELSTIGYLLDNPKTASKYYHKGCGAFWVCDEHNHNTELEKILQKGIDKKELDMGPHGNVMLWMPSDEMRENMTK